MLSLFQLLIKNFKILTRSKAATVAIFFGPIALVLLLGTAFNTAQLHGLKLATYSHEYNNLTDSIVSKLSSQFEIIKATTNESCIQGIKVNEWHVCFIFPKNFSIEGNNKIDFYVNPAHINLVHTVTNIISAKIEERTEEIRISLIENIMQRATTIEDSAEKCSKSITIAKNAAAEINKILTEMQQSISQLNLKLSIDEFKLTDLKNALDKIKAENDKISSQAASINETSIRQAIENASSTINIMLNDATNITSDIETVASLAVSKLDTASKTIQDAKQKISIVMSKLNEITKQLDSLDNAIKNIKEQAKKIKSLSASQIAQPITASIKQVMPEKKYLELILPFLIALLLFFGGIFLGSIIIMSEKKSKAYFRNFILPVNRSLLAFSTYLTAVIIIILQVLVLFAILTFVIKPPFLWPLFLIIFLISSIFILVGMCIGYASRTAETSVLITIAVILVLLFFSNLVLPVETIASLQKLAIYNPLTIATETIRGISLLGIGINFYTNTIIILTGYVLILFSLSFLLQEWSKRYV